MSDVRRVPANAVRRKVRAHPTKGLSSAFDVSPFGSDASVVIPTVEGARHGFDVPLTRPQVKELSYKLAKDNLARIRAGNYSAGEKAFFARQKKAF